MIKELAKKDLIWRKIALSICKDKQLADDLVQDMYLKIYQINPKKVNKSYISYCIYHLFLAHIKNQNKTISLEKCYTLPDTYDESVLKDRIEITKALQELELYDCEILLHTQEDSLRNKSKELGITVDKLFYGKKKAFKKLLNTKTIKQSLKDKKNYGKT